MLESPEFSEILAFALWEVPGRLSDPAAREALLAHDWSGVPPEFRRLAKIANVFENMGLLVKNNIIDKELVCDMWVLQNPAINENFEYLAALGDRWLERHPRGAYPANAARMPQSELWPEMERKIAER